MSFTIREHIGQRHSVEPLELEIDTVKEFLSLKFLRRWSMSNDFKQFSYVVNKDHGNDKVDITLMAEKKYHDISYVAAHAENVKLKEVQKHLPEFIS